MANLLNNEKMKLFWKWIGGLANNASLNRPEATPKEPAKPANPFDELSVEPLPPAHIEKTMTSPEIIAIINEIPKNYPGILKPRQIAETLNRLFYLEPVLQYELLPEIEVALTTAYSTLTEATTKIEYFEFLRSQIQQEAYIADDVKGSLYSHLEAYKQLISTR